MNARRLPDAGRVPSVRSGARGRSAPAAGDVAEPVLLRRSS
ncbi:hypothetical protein ABZO31_07460 [Streptomyces sp. HUAS MG47]